MDLQDLTLPITSKYISENLNTTLPGLALLNSSHSKSRLVNISDNLFNNLVLFNKNNSLSINSIVTYIAGYVTKKLNSLIKCDLCCKALFATNHGSIKYNFLKVKSNGRLLFPSDDVIEVCLICEKVFKTVMAQLPFSEKIRLSSVTLQKND